MNAVQNEWGSWHLAVSGTCRYFTPTLRPSLALLLWLGEEALIVKVQILALFGTSAILCHHHDTKLNC